MSSREYVLDQDLDEIMDSLAELARGKRTEAEKGGPDSGHLTATVLGRIEAETDNPDTYRYLYGVPLEDVENNN